MLDLGSFVPANFSVQNPKIIDTWPHWQYIRIVNNSPYSLKITFAGQGTMNFPEMFLEDVRMSAPFSGQIVIAPTANFSATTIARALSNLVSVIAFGANELLHPQAQPIGTLTNAPNAAQAYQAAFVNSLPLDISVAGNSASTVLNNTFPNIGQVSSQQPGFLLLGYLRSSNARELIVPYRNGFREGVSTTASVTIPIGGNTQNFQLVNSQAIGSVAFESWSASNAGLGVNAVNCDRNDSNFQAVGLAPSIISTSGNQTLSLINQFGPYGFEGYAPPSGGLRVQIGFTNTTGIAQSVFLVITGSRFAFDDALLAVSFTDWASPANVFALGVVRLNAIDQIPLNFLVPTPITNNTQVNFGTLTYQVDNVTEFYATKFFSNKYTIDTVIPTNLVIPGS